MARTVFEARIRKPDNLIGFTPSLFKRILGAKSGPKIYEDIDGVEIREYSGDCLRPILYELINHLKESISISNESVEAIWSYYDIDPVDYYIYERQGEWFASFIFSGCAGMADVSQVVICHWLNILEMRSPSYCRTIFKKYGIEILEIKKEYAEELILPFSGFGYALYDKPEKDVDFSTIDSDSFWEYNPFTFDAAIFENEDDMESRILNFLKNTNLDEIPCTCKCIFCDPTFSPIQA